MKTKLMPLASFAIGRGTAVLLLSLTCSLALPQETGGWKTISGGPGTGCATNASPYEFYVREGDSKKLAVYFQGGGACWNSKNCGLEGRATFENAVDERDRPWTKGNNVGVFDLDNAANPLRDFTLIYAPYCSADVHLGLGTAHYASNDGKKLDIHHRGLANSQRVMDWVKSAYSNPKRIFVSGGSAGAIPSPVFASQFARHYPRARVVQLGDGAGGYRSVNVTPILEFWGATRALKHDPLFADLDVASATFEHFYSGVRSQKNLQLSQVNSVEDSVQIFFLGELGHKVDKLAPLLNGNLDEIRATNQKFRTYTMPGTVHTILQRADFYATTVDGVPLSKWIGDLINGRKVPDVGNSLLSPGVDRLK